MKNAKKILALLMCAVLLVGASIAGTVAYLTSYDGVTNTFTVGKVEITLDEAPVDVNGQAITGDRVKENTYHLLPGLSYDKDPIIHVAADSEDCYLFVRIDNGLINDDGESIEDPANTVAMQMAANGWIKAGDYEDTYVYVGTEEGASTPLAVEAGANIPVFATIKIAKTIGNDTLAAYADEEITVYAYALQADGIASGDAVAMYDEAFGA